MKALVLTPTGRASSRSSASATVAAAAISDRSEGGKGAESCYFPGCRKDAKCYCKICLASIDATRDLFPSGSSIQQRSSLTKLSASAPSSGPHGWASPPTPPESSPSCTPEGSETGSAPASPPLRSTAKSRPSAKKAQKGGSWPTKWHLLRWAVVLCLVLTADFGIPAAVQEMLGGPMLTAEMVKMAGERSRAAGNLRETLLSLQERFGGIVGTGRMTNCTSASSWGFHQEGRLFRETCVIYKSAMEEVSIWGCPVQASGWLVTGFSSRCITLLSGRISEWSAENLSFTSLARNGSWTYGQWTTTAVHLDPNTWVLEYRSSSLQQKSRVLPLLWELFKIRLAKKIKDLQHGSP
ncbi:hypothetical protein Taro_038178, partial [Colocasia esculenta]|nr:hypothetical protein [Colocasia esculenta]